MTIKIYGIPRSRAIRTLWMAHENWHSLQAYRRSTWPRGKPKTRVSPRQFEWSDLSPARFRDGAWAPGGAKQSAEFLAQRISATGLAVLAMAGRGYRECPWNL